MCLVRSRVTLQMCIMLPCTVVAVAGDLPLLSVTNKDIPAAGKTPELPRDPDSELCRPLAVSKYLDEMQLKTVEIGPTDFWNAISQLQKLCRDTHPKGYGISFRSEVKPQRKLRIRMQNVTVRQIINAICHRYGYRWYCACGVKVLTIDAAQERETERKRANR